MAVGVYQALYQAELQVPQDIAVIGYDDIELASFMTPPLTTCLLYTSLPVNRM